MANEPGKLVEEVEYIIDNYACAHSVAAEKIITLVRRACAEELREMAADILARHEMNEHVARVMRQAADRIEAK